MGNRFVRGRETPATTAEAAAAEQKTAAEPAAEDAGITQTQEAVKAESQGEVMGEPVAVPASLPTEECTAEVCEVVEPPASSLTDAEPEPVVNETPAPVQPEPLVSVSEPSPPESEPVAEAQLAPEPAPEPVPESVPEPEPEPVVEPEAVPEPEAVIEAEVEVVPEPIQESVPAPADATEQQTDLLSQESLPEPVISSAPLSDLVAAEVTLQPSDIPAEPSNISVTEECQASAEIVIPTCELENIEETAASLEKLEVEAAGKSEQLLIDVNEENVCGLLQNIELKGNDLVSDLIPTDAKIPDDMSTTTELM